jgi:hypothetical protein
LRAILLTLILLFASCGRKTYHSIESKVIDSVIVKIERIKAPVLNDFLVVDGVCQDSIKTEFKRILVRDTDTIIVELKDNQLIFDVKQKEKTIKELKETLKVKEIEVIESKKERKIWWKPILIMAGIIALFIIFPIAPSSINKILRLLF